MLQHIHMPNRYNHQNIFSLHHNIASKVFIDKHKSGLPRLDRSIRPFVTATSLELSDEQTQVHLINDQPDQLSQIKVICYAGSKV